MDSFEKYMNNLENEIEAVLLHEQELLNQDINNNNNNNNNNLNDEIQKEIKLLELRESITSTKDKFSFGDFINSGSFGVVINGFHNSNEDDTLALKFFGYTRLQPIKEWMDKEILILLKLYKCKHVAQIKYIFQDTSTGLIPYGTRDLDGQFVIKRNFNEYPVIAMEKLCGGNLFTKINDLINQGIKFTEKEISIIFRNFIIAINEVHEMTNFINCDLKCDNIVFVTNNPNDLSIKIIDFGLGLEIKENNDYIVDKTIFGTRGLVAPETLLYYDNHKSYYFSKATDIWQAGCILYTMLAAEPPFKLVPNSASWRDDVKKGDYIKDNNIQLRSKLALDLISRILTVDPSKRLTGPEILLHPWIKNNNDVSKEDLGLEYRKKIKLWEYRKKFKKILADRISLSKQNKRELKKFLSKNYSTLSSTSLKQLANNNNNHINHSNIFRLDSDTSEISSISTTNSRDTSPRSGPVSMKEINIIQLNNINDNTIEYNTSCKDNSFDINENTEFVVESIAQYEEMISNDNLLNDLQILSINNQNDKLQILNPKDIDNNNNNNSNNNNDINNNSNNNNGITNNINNFIITEIQFRNLQRNYVTYASSTDVSSIPLDTPLTNKIRPSSITKHIGVDYNTFSKVLTDSDLNYMAKPEIFEIFDTNRTGYVDYIQFLINLSSFRKESHVNRSPERLYFEIFDIDNSDSISKDELICVLSKLLEDSINNNNNNNNNNSEKDDEDFSIDMINNINFDELFNCIDGDDNGSISFDEFEIFLKAINNSTTKI